MSDTTKAGVVTRLWVEASRYFYESPFASPSQLRVALEDAASEPGRLDQLDVVAAWTEEFREVVGLFEALPEKARAILPSVLRGMAAHPGACAALEASMGPPVSTAARVAAWAGELVEDDLRTVLNALLRPGTDPESQNAQELGHQLLAILHGGDLDLGAERLANQRMPRRQLKGTCPPVEAGQKRIGDGWDEVETAIWTVKHRETPDRWFCEAEGQGPDGTDVIDGIEDTDLLKMPLAEDFVPSDLAGLAKREAQPAESGRDVAGHDTQRRIEVLRAAWEQTNARSFPNTEATKRLAPQVADVAQRVWKAGTVPPVVMDLMVLVNESGELAEVLDKRHGSNGRRWIRYHAQGYTTEETEEELMTWKLAADFPIPEDFAC